MSPSLRRATQAQAARPIVSGHRGQPWATAGNSPFDNRYIKVVEAHLVNEIIFVSMFSNQRSYILTNLLFVR